MKIAHLGTFDVGNYGDLLFPLVAEWRMPSAEWIHASPRGGKSQFVDSVDPICFEDLMHKSFDAVMVGGGNIVHLRRSSLDNYAHIKNEAYASFSIGAANLASLNRVQLVFNAPSIRKCSLGMLEKALLRKVIKMSSYCGFRDRYSVELSKDFGCNLSAMVPDTALDISRMWPTNSSIFEGSGGHIAVHVNHRYGGDAETTAKALDEMAKRSNSSICFLPIGPCHGDIEYMYEVKRKMSSPACPITNLSLRFFADQISKAKFFVGSSMHGFITGISYGVPSLLVLNEHPLEKFAGLLDILGAPSEVICRSWVEAVTRLNIAWEPGHFKRDELFETLDAHWERLEIAIVDKSSRKNSVMLNYWKKSLQIAQFEVDVRRIFPWLIRKLCV